jgi:phosphatidylglycerophosphate synthase
MKREYLTVPNVLSLSRLILLPMLFMFVITGQDLAFLISFIIIGSTDFFDGYIARKFDQKTEIGKTLDSLADLFFYLSCAWFLYRLYPHYLEPNNQLLFVFFGLLALSFLISGILLKKPILMHTFLFKLNAVLVYLLIIFSYFTNTTYFIAFILVVYIIGFIEEIIIFIKYGEVDPDTMSVFSLRTK